MSSLAEPVVVDASVIMDLLLANEYAAAADQRLRRAIWYSPAHVDGEALSALGRKCRAGDVPEEEVERRLAELAAMPLRRQLLPPLLPGAWSRRGNLRLADALYVELASQLDAPLVTTDRRLASATPLAEAIEV